MRDYSSQMLVDLPRLNGSGAVSLITALLTVADDESRKATDRGATLPPLIERSRLRLSSALQQLNAALLPTVPPDSEAARQADITLDRAWGTLRDFLTAWSRLPSPPNPHSAQITRLNELLFSDGLRFLNLPYHEEWQASQARLDALKAEGLGELLVKLGGTLFLSHLEQAQRAYGESLGITAVAPEAQPSLVRETLTAALNVLREYVTRAVAWADPDLPETQALSNALLAPLAGWKG